MDDYLLTERISKLIACGSYGVAHFAAYRLILPADITQNTAAVIAFTLYHRGYPVP